MRSFYSNVYHDSKDVLIKRVNESLEKKKKEFIITANAEIFVQALKNDTLSKMLENKNNIVTADGVSIVKTAKYFNIDVNNKITGVDICEYLLNLANNKKYSVFIFGSKEEVLTRMKEKFKNINFVGLKNGYDNDKEIVKKDIIKSKADILIVALGVPNQEIFINSIYDKLDRGICIGVGGSLDVISGCKKRAPKIFIKCNLEWFYRILREPKRIKRFFDNNIKLLFIAKKEAKKEAKNAN